MRTLGDDEVIRTLTRRGQGREPLGFGYAELAALVTPVVWGVLDQVSRRTIDMATDTAITRSRARLRRLMRRDRTVPPQVLPVLTPPEMALLRAHILERGAERGIALQDAEALADSVLARIATGTHPSLPSQPETPAEPEALA
ncbi:hypothetical protein [Streptomyces sp. TP-A0356]|uniref:hypothetical protein n=1 Tax=Streptomyces sp. TP-A0356 TaxID=1359208 RepID=UPI0018FE2C63|nr:hypothetical protein [Streptomyces sp. TP-A0356]